MFLWRKYFVVDTERTERRNLKSGNFNFVAHLSDELEDKSQISNPSAEGWVSLIDAADLTTCYEGD